MQNYIIKFYFLSWTVSEGRCIQRRPNHNQNRRVPHLSQLGRNQQFLRLAEGKGRLTFKC